jgi:peptidase M66-like protein
MVFTRPTDVTLLLVVLVGAACGGGDSSRVTSPGGGAIAVQVSGLPTGTSARVTVTGPTGAVTTLTGSQLLTGLAAGSYSVSAGYVTGSNQTWSAQVSPTLLTVVQDDTAQVAVTYTGGPAPTIDLRIAGVQLIQSTQRSDGSVPMIAGRDALLRVFVIATGGQQAQPTVRVRLFSGGLPVDSVSVPAPVSLVPTAVDTASLASSWNVLIPGARVMSNLSLQAVVDPGDEVAETDESDNLWPGNAPQSVAVQSVPSFALRFVPVRQSVNNLTGRVSATNKDSLAETSRRMHPLGSTAVSLRQVYVTSAPVLVSDDANGAWSQILSEIYTLRNNETFGGDYTGIVQVTYGGGIAGLGYVGAPAAISWDKASSAAGVIAHELGHNFGRNHAPCGNPSGPDPNYPYPDGSIGTWGLDLPALTLKAPGTYKDVMSYCNPDWISDYNYMAILSFRGGSAVRQAASQGPAQDGLMVWGRIRNGTVVLEPSFRVHAPIRLPEQPGANQVSGYDVNGNRVFGVSFDGVTVADLPGGEERHFAFVVPLTGGEMSRLATMRLTGRGLTVRQTRTIPVASARGPEIVQRPDAAELRWDPAYPLAVVRDAATGEIISFARGGNVRIPSGNGPVTLELSEGVSSLPAVQVGTP